MGLELIDARFRQKRFCHLVELELIGIGHDYLVERKHSTFTAEVHVRYLRELHASDPVRVTFQLLDYDAKRIH